MTEVTTTAASSADAYGGGAARVTNPWRPEDRGPWAAAPRRPVGANPWLADARAVRP